MATCADVAAISRALSVLIAGAPLHAGALTVVPLLAPPGGEPDWLTLADAGDAVEVTEVSESGAVPTLRLVSRADRRVLLLDGEELVGAKQNRVLNTTVLVAAGATIGIPVSCVEQGRWAWRSARFASSDVSLYASSRGKKAARVSESLRTLGRHEADQGEVWHDVARRAASLRVESPTDAMHDVYARHEGEMQAAREAVAPRAGQVGAAVWIAGAWAGFEVLAAPGLFARAWPRLASGYIADAIGRKPRETFVPDAGEIRDAILRATAEPAPAVALGVEQRLAGPQVVGAALVVDERVAHLMAFPAERLTGGGQG